MTINQANGHCMRFHLGLAFLLRSLLLSGLFLSLSLSLSLSYSLLSFSGLVSTLHWLSDHSFAPLERFQYNIRTAAVYKSFCNTILMCWPVLLRLNIYNHIIDDSIYPHHYIPFTWIWLYNEWEVKYLPGAQWPFHFFFPVGWMAWGAERPPGFDFRVIFWILFWI